MGRPPCCDKVGIKKGPWTPEEDILLVSYIQEHGPGNWSAVPTNTGLMRCSKSCRLRWTNYLRPGIKRGNFTPHEEGIIIHLQALLGNKWAAIASYLPQRTDNDIKNYWNTHLKKKLKKLPSSVDPQKAVCMENSSMYASNAENISILMENWKRSTTSSSSSSSSWSNMATTYDLDASGDAFYRDTGKFSSESTGFASKMEWCSRPQESDGHGENGIKSDELERILPSDHSLINGMACDYSQNWESSGLVGENMKIDNDLPLLSLEKWLMDENANQVEGDMEISPIF